MAAYIHKSIEMSQNPRLVLYKLLLWWLMAAEKFAPGAFNLSEGAILAEL